MFESVRARVESGDYLDIRTGFPDVDLEGGGVFVLAPDGRRQREYLRGDSKFDSARAAGLLVPLPPLSPVSPEALADFETQLGWPLPALLRRCYTELGDGGFGPAYALPSLATMREEYIAQQQNWPELWPISAAALLPICHWGCSIVSYVDVSDSSHRMWAIDPTEPDQMPLFMQSFDFTEWMRRWIEGTWLQPCAPYDETIVRSYDGMTVEEFNALGPGDPWADTRD